MWGMSSVFNGFFRTSASGTMGEERERHREIAKRNEWCKIVVVDTKLVVVVVVVVVPIWLVPLCSTKKQTQRQGIDWTAYVRNNPSRIAFRQRFVVVVVWLGLRPHAESEK